MFRRKQNKKQDLEVNVTDGKNIKYDEEIPIEEVNITNDTKMEVASDLDDDDDDDDDTNDSELQLQLNKNNAATTVISAAGRFRSETPDETSSSHSAAGNNTKPNKLPKASSSLTDSSFDVRPKSGTGVRGPKPLQIHSSNSDSDSDDDGLMVMEQLKGAGPIPGEYNAEKFNELHVSTDIRELFQYITKYTPQHLNLDYKFKPFVPDYIPAVGDIDAFLKVMQPDRMLGGEITVPGNFSELGLNVLDEPAANQSDSALLHLQLRAVSVTTNKDNKNMIIKKIENVEKNTKTIDKWIIDISDLHRAKPPPMVKYTNPMPDIDNLMQEWPPAVEMRLRKDGFPSHKLHCTLVEYIEMTCAIFDVPVYEKKIQSLHLLFSLYIAIKNSQLYNLGAERVDVNAVAGEFEGNGVTDQLILD